MSKTNKNNVFFVCSHSAEADGGIYTFELAENGKPKQLSFIRADRPSYAIISDGMLYATLREPLPMQSGIVKYKINDDFSLTQIGDTEPTHGGVAAHLCVHRGKVYCANYLGGTTICLPDKMAVHNGKGINPIRQLSSHPHQVLPTPDGNFMVINDLGTDTVRIFDLQLQNEVFTAKTPDGSGARHGIFSNDGKYYYCVGEMGSNVSVFEYENGKMKYINTTSVLPGSFNGQSTASAIRMFKDKIYISNRGHDSVCVLSASGSDISVEGFIFSVGESPREFNFVNDFLVCGNENTDDITVFRMRSDGFADYCGNETKITIKKPWGITPLIG